MANHPISVRLSDVHQSYLAVQEGTPSSVIQDGIDRMSRLRSATNLPLYARLVHDPRVESVIEEAVSAACDVLDTLFPEGPGIELKGVNSNFQGLLIEHIKAMLTGTEAANRRWTTPLNALLATDHSFGRLLWSRADAAKSLGYTVVKFAQQRSESDLFLDPDAGWCELARLQPGGLFTSPEFCVEGVLARLEREELSPRAEGVRLCAILITDKGPLQVHGIAALHGESAIDADQYRARIARMPSAPARR